ncbi:MAG: S41 family peptidase [Bacteroidales bacterium]|jgi:hypothetical protein|nr:S41 family peptidase [Bacteroidales bacterium]
MKNKKLYICYFFIAIFLYSCESYFFEEQIQNTPEENFRYLWNEINEKYSFFDVKQIDWDSIYSVYQPMIRQSMSDGELFSVLGSMLNQLKDGHVNLISPFNVSRYDISLLGKENINERLVKEKYLGNDYFSTGSFRHNYIMNGNIGYIRYSSFSDSQITNYELDFILKKYKGTEGLIIDLRQNGGGYVSNVFRLLSRFSNKEKILYTTQIKSGTGRNDFSDLEVVSSTSGSGEKYFNKVAVLIDRGTFSASSFFALSTYAYDNMFLVGDTTGGGLGLPNGGQLPNGWTYRCSVTRTIAADGNNYENGVPPDYTVILSDYSVSQGIDNVIEFAAEKILENNY